jgi:hypothetical protein
MLGSSSAATPQSTIAPVDCEGFGPPLLFCVCLLTAVLAARWSKV